MGKPAATDRPYLRSLSHSFTLDLVIFSPTHEKAVEAQHLLSTWLGTRGLRLSDEKTHIRHLREGFNFLGFVRHEGAYTAVMSERSGHNLVFCHQYPTKTCDWSNLAV